MILYEAQLSSVLPKKKGDILTVKYLVALLSQSWLGAETLF